MFYKIFGLVFYHLRTEILIKPIHALLEYDIKYFKNLNIIHTLVSNTWLFLSFN